MSQSLPPTQQATASVPPTAPREGSGPAPGQGEDPDRLAERAAVPVAIATGVLGGLLAIGFALLPVSTLAEKSYVIAASLALSVASVSGIGAWRSGRRFAFTAGLAGAALACLAALSVAAQAAPPGASTSVTGAMGSAGLQSSAAASATATAATAAPPPSQSLGPAPSGSPLAGAEPLIGMPPVNAISSGLQSGPQIVANHRYQQTLSDGLAAADCGNGNAPDATTYTLDGKYRLFSVVVGLAESSPSGYTVRFSVKVDTQVAEPEPALVIGQTATINVNVTGAYRLTLQDSCINVTDPGNGLLVTAVWINPAVSG